ncbi:MAG TPA: hypothetical protein VHU23_11710 [Rhizomicrobium sp.]|jgi:hypothetical protein|nr:hypothetical protein [Rhizomicrobium sp.]
MACFKTGDGTEIYYNDWGGGQPAMLSSKLVRNAKLIVVPGAPSACARH